MKPLIEVIAKALVDHPEEVSVKEIEKDQTVVYQLSVHPDDMGSDWQTRTDCQVYSHCCQLPGPEEKSTGNH